MTVAEWIENLKEFPQDQEVRIKEKIIPIMEKLEKKIIIMVKNGGMMVMVILKFLQNVLDRIGVLVVENLKNKIIMKTLPELPQWHLFSGTLSGTIT